MVSCRCGESGGEKNELGRVLSDPRGIVQITVLALYSSPEEVLTDTASEPSEMDLTKVDSMSCAP